MGCGKYFNGVDPRRSLLSSLAYDRPRLDVLLRIMCQGGSGSHNRPVENTPERRVKASSPGVADTLWRTHDRKEPLLHRRGDHYLRVIVSVQYDESSMRVVTKVGWFAEVDFGTARSAKRVILLFYHQLMNNDGVDWFWKVRGGGVSSP